MALGGMGVAAAGRQRDGRLEMGVIVIALVIVVIGAAVARDGVVPGYEEALFHAVNDLPGWLYPVAWPFQQVGALVVGPVVAAVALVLRKYRLAIAVASVTVLKLLAERIVKVVVSRERPGTSVDGVVHLRGDVPAFGESFVSGHAVLVAALAGVVTPYLPGRWRVLPWVLVAGVMIGRVYVGAHNPLDVVCGAALGVVLAVVMNAVLGVRRFRHQSSHRSTRRLPGS